MCFEEIAYKTSQLHFTYYDFTDCKKINDNVTAKGKHSNKNALQRYHTVLHLVFKAFIWLDGQRDKYYER